MAKLTEKQKRFMDFYIELGNAAEAARRAGYKASSEKAYQNIGSENLAKLGGLMSEKIQAKDNERIASQDEVLRFLTAIMRNEETEEVVVVENIGDFTSEAKKIDKKLSAKDRVRAAELLGKRYCLFTDKINLDADMNFNISIDYGGDPDED